MAALDSLNPSFEQFAVRTDADKAISESVFFFGEDGSRMFACLHAPVAEPRAVAVICPSIHAEMAANYRQEVLLGRALAERGTAALRFHYVGSGSSDGHEREATFDSMVQDTRRAVTEVLGRSNIQGPVVLAGVRWGALVAASTAADHRGAPLVLWEPVMDPKRFFREAIRARLIREIKEGTPDGGPSVDLMKELSEVGMIDIVGYPIDKRLYDSALGHSLVAELGDDPRPIQLVQLNQSKELRTPMKKSVEELRSRGFSVDVELIPDEPSWWLSGRPVQMVNHLVEISANWVADKVGS